MRELATGAPADYDFLDVRTINNVERMRKVASLEDPSLFDFQHRGLTGENLHVQDASNPRVPPWMTVSVTAPDPDVFKYWSIDWGVWCSDGSERWFVSFIDRLSASLPDVEVYIAAGLSRYRAGAGIPAYFAARVPPLRLDPTQAIPGFYWFNVLSARLARTLPPREVWPTAHSIVDLDDGAVGLKLAERPSLLHANDVTPWMSLLSEPTLRRLVGEWWRE